MISADAVAVQQMLISFVHYYRLAIGIDQLLSSCYGFNYNCYAISRIGVTKDYTKFLVKY